MRSLGGAIFVLSAVLYPYVYLTARASFVQQSVCVLEVARTLGRTPLATFADVALPLARPALAAGVALVLMECLNDLGAVQYLGVETLSASIYATWLQRSNLGGAAQIAAVMLRARRRAVRHRARGARRRAQPPHDRPLPRHSVPGAQRLEGRAGRRARVLAVPARLRASPCWSSPRMRRPTPSGALASGFLDGRRQQPAARRPRRRRRRRGRLDARLCARAWPPNRFMRSAVRVAALGYAVPGTVLAIGLLIPLAGFDNHVDAFMRATFGVSTGLLLSGSLFAITLAYVIRFLAVALGAHRGRPRAHLAQPRRRRAHARRERAVGAVARAPAAAAAGARRRGAARVRRRHEGAAGDAAAAPVQLRDAGNARLLLAAIEQLEQASLGALTIVLVGLVPVLLLHEAIAGGRPGESKR